MTAARPTLVFPAGMAAARSYADEAMLRGEALVGASSLPFDPARSRYDAWAHLPFYNDPQFESRLGAVIRDHGVAVVYTPHPVIHAVLQTVLPRVAPDCRLSDQAPYARELAGYRACLRDAPLLTRQDEFTGAPPLSTEAAAALLRQTRSVPGMCDDEKLWALSAIARSAPRGDIVEIGSWWGKSATALAWLARHYGLGNLLCVDPWTPEGTRQDVAELDAVSATSDHDEAARIFQVNLLSLASGGVNFLRMPSVEGAARYQATPVVRSDAFGETRYAGRIGLLHIDGNHEFEAVAADLAAWLPLLADKGWLVLDDYLWPFGDGPRRVGDALLRDRATDVLCAFTTGSALFVRLGGGLVQDQ